MKKLILLMLLLTSCGSETLLLKHSEIYIQQPITKIENMQWSEKNGPNVNWIPQSPEI